MGFKLQRITQINIHSELALSGQGALEEQQAPDWVVERQVLWCFCKLMTIWFCAAHRLMLSNSSTR